MYIEPGLNGLGKWKVLRKIGAAGRKITRPIGKVASVAARATRKVARPFVKIATAPLKITSAALRGKSIRKSAEENILKPTGSILRAAAPILPFIPVIGTAAAGVLAIDTLRRAKAAAKDDERTAAAIDAEIAKTEAKIRELTPPPMTANAAAGAASAAGPGGDAEPGEAGAPADKLKIPWMIIAPVAAIAAAVLLKS